MAGALVTTRRLGQRATEFGDRLGRQCSSCRAGDHECSGVDLYRTPEGKLAPCECRCSVEPWPWPTGDDDG